MQNGGALPRPQVVGTARRYITITNPVVPDATGSTLVQYFGPTLTAGNELDKLASNVGVGRSGPCGVHWRSDCDQGMFLGEACTIAVLQDMRRTWNESFVGFSFKKFDGTPVTISQARTRKGRRKAAPFNPMSPHSSARPIGAVFRHFVEWAA